MESLGRILKGLNTWMVTEVRTSGLQLPSTSLGDFTTFIVSYCYFMRHGLGSRSPDEQSQTPTSGSLVRTDAPHFHTLGLTNANVKAISSIHMVKPIHLFHQSAMAYVCAASPRRPVNHCQHDNIS